MAEKARRGGPEPERNEGQRVGPEADAAPVPDRERRRYRRPPRGQGRDSHLRQRGPRPPREPNEVPFGRHASLHDALRGLLSEIRACTHFERVVVLVRFNGHEDSVVAGVTDEDAAAVISELTRGHARGLRDWPGVPARFADVGLTFPASFTSPMLVPFGDRALGFQATVVVDCVPSDSALGALLSVARRAAPDVSRLAEVESLRARIHEAEAHARRLGRVLDMLPDPVLVTDARDDVLLTNVRAEHLFTARPGDRAGRQHAVETNNLYFSAFRARAVLREGVESEHRELLLVDPDDGSDLLFEVFHHPFSTGGRRPDSTIHLLRDITDLRRVTDELEEQYNRSLATEHEARRESERLTVIIENAGVPILVTDRQTRIVLMNREAERLFEPADGDAPADGERITPAHPNDAKLTALINDFMLQPQRLRQEYLELHDAQGRSIPVEALSTKIVDHKGEPTAVVTVLHDQTQEVENERMAAELRRFNEELAARVAEATRELAERNRQLEIQSAELERASRLKTEFLATMSHELRTPINATLGYNALLREGLFGPLTNRQKDALERIRTSAEHLLAIINDILDLTNVEAGRVVLHATDVDPARLVAGLSAEIGEQAARKSLQYRAEVEEDLPHLRIDETRLRQVLLNLLANAVKFTQHGSVTLTARRAPAGDAILFEVVDTGIGIEEDQLEAIFEEFRQVDQSITREHGGTGLGLAISRKLLRLMGGALDVESAPAEGSRFTVRLPASFAAPPPRDR